MKDISGKFIIRDMLAKDIPMVIEIHHDCFPASVSLFTALPKNILEKYYSMFISEGCDSSAAVIEMEDNGLVVGYTFGTREPGIRKRFIKKYFISIVLAVTLAFIRSIEFRTALIHKNKNENTLYLMKYNELLNSVGVPLPQGREDIWMGLAIHSAYRGGGKASSLVDYYCKRVFEMSDATRIRGAILKNNAASIILFKRLGWKTCDVTNNQISIWKERK